MNKELKDAVLSINCQADFESLCLEVFRFQAKENPVYSSYLKALGTNTKAIKETWQIPFLPISFFKTHQVLCKQCRVAKVFESSGTTGMQTSKHYLADLDFYREVSKNIFEQFYGDLADYTILALLPSYLERGNSSLVFMVEHFIRHANENSGFFLHNLEELVAILKEEANHKKKYLLLGVTFGLLDLAKKYEIDLSPVIVMETGGMKGRRREMIREEVHALLKAAFNVSSVHSEYGMTELLSQFYAREKGFFEGPSWANLLIREPDDPFSKTTVRQNGIINVIDLANIDSCSFIETRDLGKINVNNSGFEVKGRIDYADVRGCNLLLA